jgi:hypothetical protein
LIRCGEFPEKDYCVFVTPDCTLEAAGGCTREYLESVNYDVSKVYGTNGAALCYVSDVTIAQVDDNAWIHSATMADDPDTAVGLCVYVYSPTGPKIGVFEITDIDSINNIVELAGFDLSYDTNYTVVMGGALKSLEWAFEAPAYNFVTGTSYNCFVYTNKDESSSSITTNISITTANDGNKTANTQVYIVGFAVTPGDLEDGGAFYQSALASYRDGVSENYPVLDGTGLTNIFSLGACENIQFRNLYMKGCSSYAITDGANISYNTGMVGCKATDLDVLMLCDYRYFVCDYFNVSCATATSSPGVSVAIDRCVWVNASTTIHTAAATTSIHAVNNLFVGGRWALQSGAYIQFYYNNVFYNQAECAVAINSPGSQINSNNIAYMSSAAGNLFRSNATPFGGGTILLADNNCVWSAEGQVTNKLAGNGTDLIRDFYWGWSDTQERNPMFRNVNGKDFRPTSSPVKAGGIPSLYDESSSIGVPLNTGRKTSKVNSGSLFGN